MGSASVIRSLLWISCCCLWLPASAVGIENMLSLPHLEENTSAVGIIETFDIDLDLPPEERWKDVMARYKEPFTKISDFIVEHTIPKDMLAKFIAAFDLVEDFWPSREYRKELEGIADMVDMPVGLVLSLNLNYELFSGCTSIVAQSSDGTVWHGRNLDYDIPGLQDVTINVRFVRDGGSRLLYEGTTYAGYIGILTGMKPGAYSLSQDRRDTGAPLWENLVEFLFRRGKAAAYPFLYRDIFENVDNYDKALAVLQDTPMIAPAYMIIAGAGQGQGAVVTRNRDSTADTWTLSDDDWFLVETNDDHWKPPMDDRRDAAKRSMEKYSPNTIGAKTMMAVMNTVPILNELTTYTAVMNAGNEYYRSIPQNDNHSYAERERWVTIQS